MSNGFWAVLGQRHKEFFSRRFSGRFSEGCLEGCYKISGTFSVKLVVGILKINCHFKNNIHLRFLKKHSEHQLFSGWVLVSPEAETLGSTAGADTKNGMQGVGCIQDFKCWGEVRSDRCSACEKNTFMQLQTQRRDRKPEAWGFFGLHCPAYHCRTRSVQCIIPWSCHLLMAAPLNKLDDSNFK